jgi:hypothetical protein
VAISPRQVSVVLGALVLAVNALSLAGQLAKHWLGHDRLLGFVRLFYVDGEGNVAAWLSSALLLVCAALLALAGLDVRLERRDRRAWWGLAAVFLYLSIDETAQVHEMVVEPVRRLTGVGGPLLHVAWILPALVLVALLGVALAGFMARLPRGTRRRFVVSAVVFLAGAVGMELAGGVHSARDGFETATYAVMAGVEELLEMAGVVFFARALVVHLAGVGHQATVAFADGPGMVPVRLQRRARGATVQAP